MGFAGYAYKLKLSNKELNYKNKDLVKKSFRYYKKNAFLQHFD